MNNVEREICARVRIIREEMRWSQADFARQIGITRNQLASIECGRTPLRYAIAWTIAKSFGVSLSWMEEGFGSPSEPDFDDGFPSPDDLKVSPRALFSRVAKHIHEDNLKSLDDVLQKDSTNENLIKQLTKQAAPRELCQMYLEKFLDGWMAAVPDDRIEDFTNTLGRVANAYIEALPKEPDEVIEARQSAKVWAELRRKNALKSLRQNSHFTNITVNAKHPSVKSPMAKLLERLNRATRQRGMKSRLAKFLGVPLANVSQWLSGEREPGGETTLRLLKWVEQQER